MWFLLKTEIGYHRNLLIASLSAFIFISFLVWWVRSVDILSSPSVETLPSIIWTVVKSIVPIFLLVMNNRYEHHQDRFYVLRPTRLIHIAQFRLIPGTFCIIVLSLFIWFLFVPFQIPFNLSSNQMLWLFGLLLAINAITLIAIDINKVWHSNKKHSLPIVIVVFTAIIVSPHMHKYHMQAFGFPYGDIVLFSLFLSTYFFSTYVFMRRKSYLT